MIQLFRIMQKNSISVDTIDMADGEIENKAAEAGNLNQI